MSVTNPESLVGTTLHDGRLRLVELRDQSPFGANFLADGPDGSVMVRIVGEGPAANERFASAFAQHVDPLTRFVNPRIARVMEVGSHEGRPFVVAETPHGSSLVERTAGGRSQPVDVIGTWLEGLARTLDELHAAGLVHGDVRPGTVYVSEHGPTLADFGLTHAVRAHEAEHGPDLTSDRSAASVAEYAPPELITGGEYGPAGDQYALGVLVYELLCGRPPFQAGSRSATLASHVEDPPPPLSVDVPRPIAIALATALAKDPEERYPTCRDFASTFVNALRLDVGSIVDLAPSASDVAPTAPVASPVESVAEERAYDSDAYANDDDDWEDDESRGAVDPEPVADDAVADEPVYEEPRDEAFAEAGPREATPVVSDTTTDDGDETPPWKRPLALVAGGIGVPLLGAVLYYGYVLFLNPGDDFSTPINVRSVARNPGATPPVAPVAPNPRPGGAETKRGSDDAPAPSGRSLTQIDAPALRARMDETQVDAKLSTNDPIEALETILAAQGGERTVVLDGAAFSLLDSCGFQLEHEFVGATLTEALQFVAERLPQLCVAVPNERQGRVTTWATARRVGLDVVDVTPEPPPPSDSNPLETKVTVDVAGKRYATALANVAAKADLDLRFDDATEEGALQDRVPANFYRSATEAGALLGLLTEGREPFVIARDPEFPTWRVTTLAVAEERGLELMHAGRAGAATRLRRAVGRVEGLRDPERALSTLFQRALETVDVDGSIETAALEREGLVDPLRDSLRRTLQAFGPDEGATGDADVAGSTLVEVLGRVLAEHDEAALVVESDRDRVTLTTRAAAEATGRPVFPIEDSIRQLGIERASRDVDPVPGPLGMEFVRIEPGRFTMGARADEASSEADERPPHEVEITRPFLLGRYEVSQAEFAAITGRNPSRFSNTGAGAEAVCDVDTSRSPVENVTWFDAVRFANALSEREGLNPYYTVSKTRIGDDGEAIGADVSIAGGSGYRLPTEAEWEFACRGGSDTAWFFGNGHGADRFTWHAGNSATRTRTASSRAPNGLGLFHVHGNVREWTDDWYRDDFYPGPKDTDPTGPRWGTTKSVRGGSHADPIELGRSAAREGIDPGTASPTIGFRLARTPEEAPPDAGRADESP